MKTGLTNTGLGGKITETFFIWWQMKLYLLERDGKKFMAMTETRLDGHGFIRLQLEKHYGITEKEAQEIIDDSRIKVKKNVWRLAFVTTEDITL